MALPNGTTKEWPFEEEPDLNIKYLPLVGQNILYGWQDPSSEAWYVQATMDPIVFGDLKVVEARFNKYILKGAKILLHQRSVKGYFAFNL